MGNLGINRSGLFLNDGQPHATLDSDWGPYEGSTFEQAFAVAKAAIPTAFRTLGKKFGIILNQGDIKKLFEYMWTGTGDNEYKELALISERNYESEVNTKGYKVLVSNIPFDEQVIDINTIYEIRNNFNTQIGEEVEVGYLTSHAANNSTRLYYNSTAIDLSSFSEGYIRALNRCVFVEENSGVFSVVGNVLAPEEETREVYLAKQIPLKRKTIETTITLTCNGNGKKCTNKISSLSGYYASDAFKLKQGDIVTPGTGAIALDSNYQQLSTGSNAYTMQEDGIVYIAITQQGGDIPSDTRFVYSRQLNIDSFLDGNANINDTHYEKSANLSDKFGQNLFLLFPIDDANCIISTSIVATIPDGCVLLNGLGSTIIEPDQVGENEYTLTTGNICIAVEGETFEGAYDFIQGVTIPAGCELRFNGGVISDCVLIGNGTIVNDTRNTMPNVVFAGDFISDVVYVNADNDLSILGAFDCRKFVLTEDVESVVNIEVIQDNFKLEGNQHTLRTPSIRVYSKNVDVQNITFDIWSHINAEINTPNDQSGDTARIAFVGNSTAGDTTTYGESINLKNISFQDVYDFTKYTFYVKLYNNVEIDGIKNVGVYDRRRIYLKDLDFGSSCAILVYRTKKSIVRNCSFDKAFFSIKVLGTNGSEDYVQVCNNVITNSHSGIVSFGGIKYNVNVNDNYIYNTGEFTSFDGAINVHGMDGICNVSRNKILECEGDFLSLNGGTLSTEEGYSEIATDVQLNVNGNYCYNSFYSYSYIGYDTTSETYKEYTKQCGKADFYCVNHVVFANNTIIGASMHFSGSNADILNNFLKLNNSNNIYQYKENNRTFDVSFIENVYYLISNSYKIFDLHSIGDNTIRFTIKDNKILSDAGDKDAYYMPRGEGVNHVFIVNGDVPKYGVPNLSADVTTSIGSDDLMPTNPKQGAIYWNTDSQKMLYCLAARNTGCVIRITYDFTGVTFPITKGTHQITVNVSDGSNEKKLYAYTSGTYASKDDFLNGVGYNMIIRKTAKSYVVDGDSIIIYTNFIVGTTDKLIPTLQSFLNARNIPSVSASSSVEVAQYINPLWADSNGPVIDD